MLKKVTPDDAEAMPLALPEWKKFWKDRGFARDMKTKGIIRQDPPPVIKRIFHAGPYFFIVADYIHMTIDHVQGVEQMLGYTPQQLYDGGVEFLVGLLHPADIEKVLGLAAYYYAFIARQEKEERLNFKGSLNLRLRKTDGQYVKVIEQLIGLHMDDEGRVSPVLKYFTDISHLNYSDEPVLSILNDKEQGNQEFYTFRLEETKPPSEATVSATFSEREKEILSHIVQGVTSKEIAAKLGISTFTVNKHRENMMRKTGSKNLMEVISFAYCNECL